MKAHGLLEEFKALQAGNGLPEDVFLAVSSITPIPNVDLFILDECGRILLSWRDDPYFGRGWHIPGGCIRFRETMEQRVQAVAMGELGTAVTIKTDPIAVRNVIVNTPREQLRNQNIRAHHIAILFACALPEGYDIAVQKRTEGEPGYLRWFAKIPENLLPVHDVYKDVFAQYDLVP